MEKYHFDIVIVGGGFTGLTIAYHLSKHRRDCVIFEPKGYGKGEYSGTRGPQKPPFNKMATSIPELTMRSFIRRYGRKKLALYLNLMRDGVRELKSITSYASPKAFKNLGSITVAENSQQWNALKKEYDQYKDILGPDYVACSPNEMAELLDNQAHTFKGGYHIERDVIVNQSLYEKHLLKEVKGRVDIVEGWRIVEIKEDKDCVTIAAEMQEEEHGRGGQRRKRNIEHYTSNHLIVATNALTDSDMIPGLDAKLKDIVTPYWSFIRCYECEGSNTPNAWTAQEDYLYFVRQDNKLVVGGCEHPAEHLITGERTYGQWRFKPPEKNGISMEKEAENIFDEWVKANFQMAGECVDTHKGIYGQVTDHLPVIGKFNDNSRVIYAVGCNGVGFTIFSIGALLVAGIVGVTELTDLQKEYLNLLSPRRASLHRRE